MKGKRSFFSKIIEFCYFHLKIIWSINVITDNLFKTVPNGSIGVKYPCRSIVQVGHFNEENSVPNSLGSVHLGHLQWKYLVSYK